jgi:hypothetical protein
MIIASVERALTSQGAGINIANVEWIRIYKSTASGGESLINTWYPGAGPSVGGVALHFAPAGVSWQPCSRTSTLPAESIGVSIRYHHRLFTPLAAITGLFGAHEFVMTDRTVMALQPGQ